MKEDFVISPHDVCDSCNGQSGPKFSLHRLSGISSAQRNNEIPTGIDRQSRLDDIRNAQLEINSLDAEIARLHRTLQVLEQRRGELRDFKDREMSLFAPVRILPDDLLKRIFLICQHDHEKKPGYIQYANPTTFVRIVTQVSNYWRNTALSMPILWSRISFKHGRDKHMSVPPNEFLRMCLVLSGVAPISIEFSTYCFAPDDLDDSCLKELATSAERWENLTVNNDYHNFKTIHLDKIMKYVPKNTVFHSLKTLGPFQSLLPITLQSTPSLTHILFRHEYSAATVSFPSAPLLTNLSTKGWSDPSRDINIAIPWSQITHYTCNDSFHDGELSQVFMDRMSNLISLTMNLNNTIPMSTYITFPRLEMLAFVFSWRDRGFRYDNSIGPLKFFTTPRLEELTVKGENNLELDAKMILDLLARSGCSIRKLSLHGDTLLLGNWNVDQVRHVEHLHLWWSHHSTDYYEETIQFLTWKRSSSTTNPLERVFPRVEILDFDFPRIKYEFPLEEYKALIISRSALPNPNHDEDTAYIKSSTLRFGVELDKTYVDIFHNFTTSDTILQSNVNVSVITKFGDYLYWD